MRLTRADSKLKLLHDLDSAMIATWSLEKIHWSHPSYLLDSVGIHIIQYRSSLGQIKSNPGLYLRLFPSNYIGPIRPSRFGRDMNLGPTHLPESSHRIWNFYCKFVRVSR